MFCRECGKELKEYEVFCGECGTAVTIKEESPKGLNQGVENIGVEGDCIDSFSEFIEETPVSCRVEEKPVEKEYEDLYSFSDFVEEASASRDQKGNINETEDIVDSYSAFVGESKSSDNIPVAKKSPPLVTAMVNSGPRKYQSVEIHEEETMVLDKNGKVEKKKKGRPLPKKKLAIKITAIVLSLCILLSSVSVALVYFNVIDIPFIREMLNGLGIYDYISEFNSLTGEFTNIKIIDDESAMEAARDGAEQLGLGDAVEELSVIYSEDVNGMVYYRIQQCYGGLPVYGKTITVSATSGGEATGFASNIKLWGEISEASVITTEQAESAFSSYAIANSLSETGDVAVLPFDEADVYYQKDSGELCLSKQMNVSVDGVPYEGVIDASSGEVYVMDCLQLQDMVQATGTDLDGNPITFDVYQEDDGTYSLMDTERNIVMYDSKGNAFSFLACIETESGNRYYYSDVSGKWYDSQLNPLRQDESTGRWFDINNNDMTSEMMLSYHFYGLKLIIRDVDEPLLISSSDSIRWGDSLSASVAFRVQTAYDYFYREFNRESFDGSGSPVYVIFNDKVYVRTETDENGNEIMVYDSSNAFSRTFDSGIGALLCFGIYNDCGLDTVAHEYTHSVERSISDMISSYESGAIKEGYSDVFGELVEVSVNNIGISDWLYTDSRNILNPIASGNPAVYNGEKWYTGTEDRGGVHHNSTVISHAAYLMSQDSQNGLLTYDELADLWYNTLFFLPSNCSFMALRDYMEMTAEILGFSDEKIECVMNAFSEVGIGEQFSYELETCSQNATVSVSDVNGDPYNNYTITIEGAELTSPGVLGEFSRNVIQVTDNTPYELNLPVGVYIITISDTATGRICARKAYKTVLVDSNNNLVFASDFGTIDIPETTMITAFEQMLTNSGDVWQFNYENGQLASMSNAEIIENFIACSGVPIGVYNVYSSEGIQFTAETLEQNAYADPNGKFWYSYELDANLVDWILLSVFGKMPDRSITSDNVYYNGDKVYVRAELGGDLGYTYTITDYEKQSDGSYEIYVESKYDAYAVESTYLKFTATPKQDSSYGVYWQIHSYEEVSAPVVNDGNSDGSNESLFRSYVNNNLSLNRSSSPFNDGVFNVLVKDFDSDGREEMVTFSLRNDDNSGAYLTIDLYTVSNGVVTLSDSSEEIYYARIGTYGCFLCATTEGDTIKVCSYDISSGGSQQTWDFLTFDVGNGSLTLLNHYYSYWYPRYDRYDYIEKVSNRTFAAQDFSTALNNAGYDYSEHFHTSSVNVNGLIPSDVGGNHIFTIVDDSYMVSQYEIHEIYNNTNFIS